MNPARMKLFWYAVAAQVVGAQVYFWDALPNYQRLTAGATSTGTVGDYALGITGIVLMQAGYWLANRLGPLSGFRRRTFLGHVMLCIGEISFFFINSLAAVILFDNWNDMEFALWKALVLAASIFAFFCYKCQLVGIGEAMLTELEPTQTNPSP
jgi:hypothetical protein